MPFASYIATRYLVSKKSHHAINIISGVSVCGVAIATAALVCILSVFNGFQSTVAGLFTSFDPELKVVPVDSKFMQSDTPELNALRENADIDVYCETMEDNALLTIYNRQVMAVVKGVDNNFDQLTSIGNILQGDGTFQLRVVDLDYGVLGINLLQQLGLTIDFAEPIQVYAPCKGERMDMTDPRENLNHEELYSPGVAFQVKQNKYDGHYVVTSKRFAQQIFEQEGNISAVELRVKPGKDIDKVKAQISKQLGSKYVVKDRYEQQEDTFKIMKIEKLISYIFLTFILMVACFNIIGSLSMLIIDKKQDVQTLRNLGANDSQIARIFTIEGNLICLVGAVIGIVIGLTLCLLQQNFGLIRFGQSEGTHIIDAYPVSVQALDIVIVFVTVLVVGFISAWYPVHHMSKKYTK